MRIFRPFALVFFMGIFSLSAQNKQVTLEEIWGGAFRLAYMESLTSLNNGKEYIVQHYDRSNQNMRVDAYSYETGEQTRNILSSNKIKQLNYFETYQLSPNENFALLGVNTEAIYRRSTRAIYFVYNLNNGENIMLAAHPVQEPQFSPDETKVAYVYENNIYVKDLASGNTTQLTQDGKKNEIINGITDWVYEEEFAFVRAFDWSADASKIAYLKFDETRVPEFSMDIYGSYNNQLYPSQQVFKYPKAGDDNAKVSLHIFDLNQKESKSVKLPKNYEYLPRLKWTKDKDVLSVQALNRHQNEMDLLFVNATSLEADVILEERDEAYVDVTDNLTFLNNNSFIWTSEKDGYNHIYHYSKKGELIKQVTQGDWEVTAFYGFDPNTGRIFFQSTENGSVNRDVYSILANGKNKLRLTPKTGTNNADFSADYSYFINDYSSVNTPSVYTLHQAKNGKLVRKIQDNSALAEKVKDYGFSPKELSTIRVNGEDLNMYMIKPQDFDENKKYPMLMYQYSGPGSQSVANTYFSTNDYWCQLLANQGYIVVTVDGRGTGFKGAQFKKVTQKELGKYELEDQIAAAKLLGERDYIDEDRIGIWGWSFGGYMSSNAIFRAGDVFNLAIAVAPVTSWRFYDTIYTERYMTTPQENPTGYDENSPITHVSKFDDTNHFLLIHGSADDNVHVQNTMQLIEALVQENKQFDWRIYPDKNHGIYGGNTRLHLYTLMTNYILKNL
ncbi:S9 family peptidase [Mesonia sp. HuA40]|uniref:S9 family peptidase n=1 Tax=Mesonia sp. HuA40 TaxID=2602761 RepID=UPI0011C896EE|nr:S9 family peptidase [Mesonia sp. HuA40]TXK71588.1 S9 family peptidase [Mesonia sp. HuA40]